MAVERIALLVSLAINLITLSFFVLQTPIWPGRPRR
jgi:hypothetical protein